MIFLKVKNSYNKKLVTWLDLNLQVALLNKSFTEIEIIFAKAVVEINFIFDIKFSSIISKNINDTIKSTLNMILKFSIVNNTPCFSLK